MHLRKVEENGGHCLSLNANEKAIYFIRHGQSEANCVWDTFTEEGEGAKYNPQLRDSPLTEKGQGQAKSLQSVVKSLDVQVVFCSPLTRAIQTACLAFENETTPIIAWPLVTEFYPDLPECHGRRREELEKDQRLTSLRRFQSVSLDNCVGDWWGCSGDTSRADSLLAWLRHSPETRVAIVCHWGVIRRVLDVARCGAPMDIANCCVVASLWHPERPQAALPSMAEGAAAALAAAAEYAVWLVPDRSRDSPLLAEVNRLVLACKRDERLRQATSLSGPGGAAGNTPFHVALTDFVPMGFDCLHQLCATLRVAAWSLSEGVAWRPKHCSLVLAGAGASSSHSNGCCCSNGAPTDDAADDKGVHLRIAMQSDSLADLSYQLQDLPAFGEVPAAVRPPKLLGATILQDNRPTGASLAAADVTALLGRGHFPLLARELAGRCKTADLRADGDDDAAAGSGGGGFDEQLRAQRWQLCVFERSGANSKPEMVPGMVWPLYSIP